MTMLTAASKRFFAPHGHHLPPVSQQVRTHKTWTTPPLLPSSAPKVESGPKVKLLGAPPDPATGMVQALSPQDVSKVVTPTFLQGFVAAKPGVPTIQQLVATCLEGVRRSSGDKVVSIQEALRELPNILDQGSAMEAVESGIRRGRPDLLTTFQQTFLERALPFSGPVTVSANQLEDATFAFAARLVALGNKAPSAAWLQRLQEGAYAFHATRPEGLRYILEHRKVRAYSQGTGSVFACAMHMLPMFGSHGVLLGRAPLWRGGVQRFDSASLRIPGEVPLNDVLMVVVHSQADVEAALAMVQARGLDLPVVLYADVQRYLELCGKAGVAANLPAHHGFYRFFNSGWAKDDGYGDEVEL